MKYKPEEEKQLMSDLWSLNIKDNPYNFVKYCFSWGQEDTPLENFTGPRKWQEKILKDIANHIARNETVDLPVSFIIGVSFISGSIFSNLFSLTANQKKE